MKGKARPSVKTTALPEKAKLVYRKVPIVVEGVDCSGKTTFCKKLVDELIDLKVNVEFHHHGPLRASVHEEYVEPLLATRFYPTVVVADRWHLGEAIYGPLYRGKSEMSDEDLEMIEKLLVSLGAKKILLDPPAEEVLRRMKERGEEFLKVEDVNKVRREYRSLARKYEYDNIRYAFDHDAKRIAKEAADECARHTLRVR